MRDSKHDCAARFRKESLYIQFNYLIWNSIDDVRPKECLGQTQLWVRQGCLMMAGFIETFSGLLSGGFCRESRGCYRGLRSWVLFMQCAGRHMCAHVAHDSGFMPLLLYVAATFRALWRSRVIIALMCLMCIDMFWRVLQVCAAALSAAGPTF